MTQFYVYSLTLRNLVRSVLIFSSYESGVSCSKLTMSLVNDLLKFQMVILQIHCYFLLTKCEMCNAKDAHILSTKNNSVFAFEVDI